MLFLHEENKKKKCLGPAAYFPMSQSMSAPFKIKTILNNLSMFK